MSDAGDESPKTTASEANVEGDHPETGGRPCPVCEEPMYSRHCKYVCPRHGVVYDCSDTFY